MSARLIWRFSSWRRGFECCLLLAACYLNLKQQAKSRQAGNNDAGEVAPEDVALQPETANSDVGASAG